MTNTPSRSEAEEVQRQHQIATAAWHEARSRTFERWLEANHDRIVELPGFMSLTWPTAKEGIVVRMETERACQEVRVLLASADLAEFDDEPAIDVRLG